jgi:hypothetical protein
VRYRRERVSKMITGNDASGLEVFVYGTSDDILHAIDDFLGEDRR